MDEDLSLSGKIGVSILIFLGFILLFPLLILFVILFYAIAVIQAVAAFVGVPRPSPTFPNIYPRPHRSQVERSESPAIDVQKKS